MSTHVQILYDGTEITNKVIWKGTEFQASAGAVPGTATILIRTTEGIPTFITGREVQLLADGIPLWGGYLKNISDGYAFPADVVPADPSLFRNGIITLTCVDYNILFDKLVIRDSSNPPTSYLALDLPSFTVGSAKDATLLKALLASYVDVPAGFDTTSEMTDVAFLGGDLSNTAAYDSQSTRLRQQWQDFAQWSTAVWYISPDKKWVWKAIESVVKRWGFSDRPNNASITSDVGYQGVTRGFRSVNATEDGTSLTNDALVWGGSPLGTGGSVVFSRAQSAPSEALHGRWQIGEPHFDESGYGVQSGVDARANAIVFGPPGADANGVLKGLQYSQWNFRFTWFADRVPLLDGVPDHIRVGDLVWCLMDVFGVERLLPCRSLLIHAENLDKNGNGILAVEGEFALNLDDPMKLWSFLLARQQQGALVIPNVTNGSTTTVLGANFQGTPTPAPNGSQEFFTLPFGYISGTLDVYVDGLLQRPGVDFFETDNVAGLFQTAFAPSAADNLYCVMRTLAS